MFAIAKMEVHVTLWMATVTGSANLDGLCPTVHKVTNVYIYVICSML